MTPQFPDDYKYDPATSSELSGGFPDDAQKVIRALAKKLKAKENTDDPASK